MDVQEPRIFEKKVKGFGFVTDYQRRWIERHSLGQVSVGLY